MASLMLSVMPARAAGDPGRGEPLYQRYCAGCHGVDGQGGAKNFMPHVGALTKKGYVDLLEDEYSLILMKITILFSIMPFIFSSN